MKKQKLTIEDHADIQNNFFIVFCEMLMDSLECLLCFGFIQKIFSVVLSDSVQQAGDANPDSQILRI